MASSALAAMAPWPSYCDHQDYTYDSETGNCIFGEEAVGDYDSESGAEKIILYEMKCNAKDFFYGTCGQEYVKEISCRQVDETVFVQFEECCRGLEPKTVGLLQATCQEMNFFNKVWQWFAGLF